VQFPELPLPKTEIFNDTANQPVPELNLLFTLHHDQQIYR
jgi:hypothetical protein